MFSLVSFKACLTISHPGFQTHLLLIHSEASAPSLADCCSTVLHSQGRVLLVSQCHSWANPPCLSQVFTPMKIWLTPYAGRCPDGWPWLSGPHAINSWHKCQPAALHHQHSASAHGSWDLSPLQPESKRHFSGSGVPQYQSPEWWVFLALTPCSWVFQYLLTLASSTITNKTF